MQQRVIETLLPILARQQVMQGQQETVAGSIIYHMTTEWAMDALRNEYKGKAQTLSELEQMIESGQRVIYIPAINAIPLSLLKHTLNQSPSGIIVLIEYDNE